MRKVVRKGSDMLKGLLPPRQCEWCNSDLAAGEMFCRVCRGNRLVPARWWPVTVASVLFLVVGTCAMAVMIAAPGMQGGAPAATTPALAGAADGTILPLPRASATPLHQVSAPAQSPLSTPVPTHTASPEPTHTETPAPASTATPMPADTPTRVPRDTATPMPTQTPVPEPTDTATLTPTVTPTSEPTQPPTNTPTPLPTSTPAPVPVANPRFRADQTAIGAGGCTVLRWDVDGVQAVLLDGEGRPGHSVEMVCPEFSHTYTLQVVMPDGRQASYPLEIRVLGYLPLTLNVLINSTHCDTEEDYAAQISIWAKGGDGQYTYYRDDLTQYIGGPTGEGMVVHLSWRTCGGAPGTFIVRSGDGQEARTPFWVEPPECCGQD